LADLATSALACEQAVQGKTQVNQDCPGSDGPYIANQLVSIPTPSSIDSGATIVLVSLVLLPSQCEKDNF
jgi:hypothetical protein